MVKKIVKPERGSIFIITLMVLVVMSILGTAILGYTLSNNKMSIHDSNFQSAYYIAETGVKYVTNKVVENIVNVYDTSNDKNEFFSKV
ncbi:MAG TPA: pilus assembly PilX N-terminal domain-containing protein, partial [Candidatus Atribacteria bacterium]|nr:pilus assembly PilX N-terminal domain-containing protein [Candidatus Atribacteria bacterium]